MLRLSFHAHELSGSEKEMKQWAPSCHGKQRLLFSVYQNGVSTIWVKKDLQITLGIVKEI